MTRTDTRPARYTYPDLCHIEALIEAHAAAMPRSVWADVQYGQWEAIRDELAAQRDAFLADLNGTLCGKCGGRGVTQYRHRLDGVCFQCNGDGWAANGRRHSKTKG